jgi:hypothetical protein
LNHITQPSRFLTIIPTKQATVNHLCYIMSLSSDIIIDGTTTTTTTTQSGNAHHVLSTVAATLVKTAVTTSSNTQIHLQEVTSDLLFWVLLMAAITFILWQPQIHGSLEFYRSCFKWKHKGKATERSRLTPPSQHTFSIIWKIVHACAISALVIFMYNYRFPTSTVETNSYIAIEVLFIIMILLEKLWVEYFWNYHHLPAPLVFSCIISFIILCISLSLLGLFAYIGATSSVTNIAFVSMGFMFVISVWYLIAFIWNCMVANCYLRLSGHCHCHKERKTYASASFANVSVKDSEVEGGVGGGEEMTEVQVREGDERGGGSNRRHRRHKHDQSY